VCCHPYAGMIRIRFCGSRVVALLSVRLDSPCVYNQDAISSITLFERISL